MDNAQREIRNEIEATRAGMVRKIATLEERIGSTIQGVKQSVDPKYQTAQHPWLAVGIAVAAGYFLSGLVLGRPAPKIVLPPNWDERVADKQAKAGMWQSMVGMLSGVISATAISLAKEYASGLLDKRRRDGRGSAEDVDSSQRNRQRIINFPR